jgi:CubicO group peptidase (beta-lactamase class C family)
MRFEKEVKKQITDLFVPYEKPDSPGYIVGVIYDNNIIFSQGFGQANLEHYSPITSKTVFDVGSVAKQFVGMMIALLEEDGQLSINNKINEYLPEFPDYAHNITIANLLHHTSGIRNYTVLAYYMMGYHESDAITKDEVFNLLVRLRTTNFKPGERWEYSDSNYFLLAEIITRITRKSLNQYASEVIFEPLKMHNTLYRECHSEVIRNRAVSYVPHRVAFQSPYLYRDPSETSGSFHTLISNYEHVGAEGLFSTLDDLFKWDSNFQDNHLGKRKPDLIKRVLSPGVQINKDIGYGFGINIGTFKGKRFFGHDGAIHGYTSSLMRFPQENLAVICLSNHNFVGAWEYRNQILDILFSITPFTAAPIQPLYRKNIDPDDKMITGRYQNPQTAFIWDIFYKDDKYYIRENNHWEFEIYYVEPFLYRTAQPDLKLTFRADSTGNIRELNVFSDEQETKFLPFLRAPIRTDKLQEYTGFYRSEELETTFRVIVDQQKLIVKNQNKHFCSMDLRYSPTIKDNFLAYDPHPISSQITFLRDGDQITAFVFRDYDGDGREALKFEKTDFPANPH